ncbi:hypothetical protein [Salinispora arenicola]|uniref:hypothetical protein n=1 Tax=Salinispora arenicola TaxID=168697 RepID=UPI0012BB6ADA|nr:hypothetical protein [Salinispora arenicola]
MSAVLNWFAAELNLPALADSGYDSPGHSILTPVKQPADGKLALHPTTGPTTDFYAVGAER